jgi:Leucine-rich repeat (LRR) protein
MKFSYYIFQILINLIHLTNLINVNRHFNWSRFVSHNGTRINASHNYVFSLRGIESFIHLTIIHLHNNRIFYIEPLADLDQTRLLDLSYNQINNLDSLSKMINLITLRLNFNQINAQVLNAN